jgi:hypothetical protein
VGVDQVEVGPKTLEAPDIKVSRKLVRMSVLKTVVFLNQNRTQILPSPNTLGVDQVEVDFKIPEAPDTKVVPVIQTQEVSEVPEASFQLSLHILGRKTLQNRDIIGRIVTILGGIWLWVKGRFMNY